MGSDGSQPENRTWRERAAGSVPRGRAPDPTVDPVPGIRAFPTVCVTDRLLEGVGLGMISMAGAAKHSAVESARTATQSVLAPLDREDASRM